MLRPGPIFRKSLSRVHFEGLFEKENGPFEILGMFPSDTIEVRF